MLKKSFLFIIAIAFLFINQQINAANVDLDTKENSKPQVETDTYANYTEVSPLQLVAKPYKFLNRNIYFNAKFDKFSAIGLDYPPVNKEAKKYISILVKRENVVGYNIPLSELKIMMKRDYAEKELVNIETGDEITIWGKVFSTALGDPWVEVENIKILTHKEKKDTDKK